MSNKRNTYGYLRVLSPHIKDATADEPCVISAVNLLKDNDKPPTNAQLKNALADILNFVPEQPYGLEIGMSRALSDFGILGYASLAGSSQLSNIHQLWNQYAEGSGILSKIDAYKTDDKVYITIDPGTDSVPLKRLLIEEVLTIFLSVGSSVSGECPQFESIALAYSPPDYHSRYNQLFNCPIQYNKEKSLVQFDSAWFERPIKGQDEELHNLMLDWAQQAQARLQKQFLITEKIKDLLEREDGTSLSFAQVASALHVSERSLSRQLSAEESTFKNIQEEVRLQKALRLLNQQFIPVKQIAHMTGFSDVNSFRRAFKRWTGLSVKGFLSNQS